MTTRKNILVVLTLGALLFSADPSYAESVAERLQKSRKIAPPKGRYRSNSLPREARQESDPRPAFGGTSSTVAGSKRFRLPKDSAPYVALGLLTSRETGVLTVTASGTQYTVAATVSGLQLRGGVRIARKSSPTYYIVGVNFFYGKGTVGIDPTSPVAYGKANPTLIMGAVEPGFGYEFKDSEVRLEVRVPLGFRFAQWDSPPAGTTLEGRTAFVPGAILYASVDRDDFGVYTLAGVSGTKIKPQFGIGMEYRF
jgi:hypothetical protein